MKSLGDIAGCRRLVQVTAAAWAVVAFLLMPGSKSADALPGGGHNGGVHTNNGHPAPAPIAGASLPVLAVGYGIYWLVRRRRQRY
jgi:hypothetical protein